MQYLSGLDDITLVLKSVAKLRILLVLLDLGEATPTQISKALGLSYPTVSRHLSELLEAGLVNEKRFGRIRVVSINRGLETSNRLARLLECIARQLGAW